MDTDDGTRQREPAAAGAPRGWIDRLVEAALAEDLGDGDRTTAWSVPDGAEGTASIVSRERGVVAGVDLVRRVYGRLADRVVVDVVTEDGGEVDPGDTVCRVSGPLAPILTGERTALNFLARLSGVATRTRNFVRALEHTSCRVTDTRKTTPGWRRLEKAATRAGGAVNHRMGLHDMVLLKENHIRAAGGVAAALDAVRSRAEEEGLAVEVEVESVTGLREALSGDPDRVLLDNMSLAELRSAVRVARRRTGDGPTLEASGGIDLETAPAVAETGVDFISVGRVTHSAPALDLSLLVDQVEGR